MLKAISAITAALIIILSPAGMSTAMADSWGCSSEKCLASSKGGWEKLQPLL